MRRPLRRSIIGHLHRTGVPEMTMPLPIAAPDGPSRPFPDDDARWAAVAARDRSADGQFYSAVVTTGVFCRPSCPGRPLRKNVRFYDTRAGARAAGFRACKRCHPDRLPEEGTLGALADRLAALDWQAIGAELDTRGCAVVAGLLDADACAGLVALGGEPSRFRSRVVMARHGFGQGEYSYFASPLPPLVGALRAGLYPPLAEIANRWARRLGSEDRFPARHEALLRHCAAAGQTKPTPLLLTYGPGDYNCLHQDVYGDVHFPLQAAVLLDEPGVDFAGGEFVLVEQRPRMQSRPEVVPLGRGDAVIFAGATRPRHGTRGDHRVTLRHGVSRVRAGTRRALGVILHDAR